MDPEDQKPKITLANFFESIKDTNVVAQRALKLSSGLSKTVEKTAGTVEVNKKDIQELQKTVSTISKDVTNIQDYIEEQQERRSRELDKREDEIFEKEDKLQKESKGDQGPLGRAKDFLDNRVDGGAGAVASAGFGPALLGLNALALSDRNFSEMVSGTVDKLTGNLFDLDRRNPNEKNPLLGALDLLSLDILDLDKRGRVIPGVKQFMNFYEGTDMGKKESEILGGVEKSFDKVMTSYNEQNIGKHALFGPLGIITKMYGDLFRKKDKSEKMNKGGSVPGSGDTDTVHAMLTPGEFVMKKEAVDRLGEGFLTSLNEDEIKKENPVVKSLKNFFSGDKKNKSDMPFELTGDSKRLIGNDKPFLKEVIRISRKYEIDPGDLLGLMASESSLNPASDNGTHVGLIQFSADRAKELGTTQEKLVKMNRAQQMKFVEKYFEIVNLPKGASKGELYTSVIMPAYTDKGGDFELMTKFDKFSDGELGNPSVYADNKGLDADSDGFITIDEMGSRVDEKRKEFGIKPVEQSKPEGLKRVLAGAADAVTGNKFDFDQRGVNPDMSDSNKDLSVNIAQNPSEGGGDIEVMEAITQQTGGSSGDGLGSSMPPPFDVASTGKPMIMNPESTSDFIDLISSKSNNAFV